MRRTKGLTRRMEREVGLKESPSTHNWNSQTGELDQRHRTNMNVGSYKDPGKVHCVRKTTPEVSDEMGHEAKVSNHLFGAREPPGLRLLYSDIHICRHKADKKRKGMPRILCSTKTSLKYHIGR